MEKFREEAAEEFIVDMLVPVYMKHFSEDDLDAAIAFHEAPAGKHFLAAQPFVIQDSMKLGEQWGMHRVEKTIRALAEEHREHQPCATKASNSSGSEKVTCGTTRGMV